MNEFHDGNPEEEPTTVHRVPWAEGHDLARRIGGRFFNTMPARYPDNPELFCCETRISGEGGKWIDEDHFEFETAVVTAKYRARFYLGSLPLPPNPFDTERGL